jgi:cell division protein FtsI (penicillin-binding protein 3)
MYERPKRRLNFLAFVLVVVTGVILGQLVRVQVFSYDELSREGELVRIRRNDLKPLRGRVWDRNGALLVSNLAHYDISAAPILVSDPKNAARILGRHLGERIEMTVSELADLLATDAAWVNIARDVPQEIGDKVVKEEIAGITVEPVWVRTYPEGDLAAHLLGFVNAEEKGYYGVEGYYDLELRGLHGTRVYQRDPWGSIIPLGLADDKPPQPGVDLKLTIDRNIQAVVEMELERALVTTGAKSGVIIVMDPRTGAILAMAAEPDYDPNRFRSVTDTRLFINPAISDHYEPGSVFKVLTMAVAIETGKFSPETTFYDEGQFEVGGQVIRNASRRAYGQVTLTEVLVRSLNVETAKVSTQLGPEVFYRGIRAFGIGHRTGVDLEGEIVGELRAPGDWQWHESDLATNAFGQGVAVTPLQMITAVAAIANDGILMKPYIVAEKTYPDGRVEQAQPVRIDRAVSAETAHTVAAMMAETVELGIPLAHVEGYQIAGKTGTAQKPTPFGYDAEKTIASFVGFAPVDDPEVAVLVRLDEPTSSEWGSETAAPTFARLAEHMFLILEIPPDDVRLELARSH